MDQKLTSRVTITEEKIAVKVNVIDDVDAACETALKQLGDKKAAFIMVTIRLKE
jgi:hypothetical protein